MTDGLKMPLKLYVTLLRQVYVGAPQRTEDEDIVYIREDIVDAKDDRIAELLGAQERTERMTGAEIERLRRALADREKTINLLRGRISRRRD